MKRPDGRGVMAMTSVTVALAAALAAGRIGPAAVAQPAVVHQAPRLLVVVVIDQMRTDYVDRYGHQWSGGLERLFADGAWFRLAAYPYLNTVTCAGHATVGSGTFPHRHGLALNEWWDRERRVEVACTDDPRVTTHSTGAPVATGHGPWRLRMPSLGDELRAQLATPPRVVTISMKARSAIMLAGHRADAVIWYEETSAGWATSTAYGPEVPAFARRYAEANPPARELERVWTRALDPGAYLFADDDAGERPPGGWSAAFPHPIAGEGARAGKVGMSLWTRSPFADDAVAALAMSAVDDLGLGQGPGLDYLGLSFSALDRVGHRFGPRSHEVQDVLVRLDATLGRLVDHLDRRVGRNRYVLALTGDHGVSPIPEQLTGHLDAGRVDLRLLGQRLQAVLSAQLGPGEHIAYLAHGDINLAPAALDRLRAQPAARAAVVAEAATTPGVWRAFWGDDLRDAAGDPDAVKRAAALSYVADRSGDIILVPQPYWITSTDAATHGTAHLYDARVPVLFVGAAITPGEYLESSTPADIAPTLAFVAGITLAAPEGRVLAEALVERPPVAPSVSRSR